MTRQFCPMCRSEDIALDGSLIDASPNAMVCKKCSYRNINFLIKEKITKLRKSNRQK